MIDKKGEKDFDLYMHIHVFAYIKFNWYLEASSVFVNAFINLIGI